MLLLLVRSIKLHTSETVKYINTNPCKEKNDIATNSIATGDFTGNRKIDSREGKS